MINDVLDERPRLTTFNPRFNRFTKASPEALERYLRRYDPENLTSKREYLAAVLDSNREAGVYAAKKALAYYGVRR
jgi:hypothetical protein